MKKKNNIKILVLGANGMLGHKITQVLAQKYEVIGTIRGDISKYSDHPILSKISLIENVHADNIDTVSTVIMNLKPNFVVNCVGIVKQLPEAQNAVTSITINALFPHQLAQICEKTNSHLIHYSTDCIYSGLKGNYSESDFPDANDLYGRTKYLGEVGYQNCLTLRTSIIGRELGTGHSLVEWFLSQEGNTVNGFNKALFSGLTTLAHGHILSEIIEKHPDLNGVLNLAADPICKYDLLNLIKKNYNLTIEINCNDEFVIDRSLNGTQFRKKTGILIPDWDTMISDMYLDEQYYKQ